MRRVGCRVMVLTRLFYQPKAQSLGTPSGTSFLPFSLLKFYAKSKQQPGEKASVVSSTSRLPQRCSETSNRLRKNLTPSTMLMIVPSLFVLPRTTKSLTTCVLSQRWQWMCLPPSLCSAPFRPRKPPYLLETDLKKNLKNSYRQGGPPCDSRDESASFCKNSPR